MIERFERSPRRGLVVAGLLVATLVVGALARPALDEMGDHGVGIVEFELARTSERASDLYGRLGEEGRDAARESLYLDFPFLILYGLFYGAACSVLAARAAVRRMPRLADLGRLLAAGALAAAAFDAIENAALLQVLDGHTEQPWPAIAFSFAAAKFLLLGAATLYLLAGFPATLRRRPA